MVIIERLARKRKKYEREEERRWEKKRTGEDEQEQHKKKLKKNDNNKKGDLKRGLKGRKGGALTEGKLLWGSFSRTLVM